MDDTPWSLKIPGFDIQTVQKVAVILQVPAHQVLHTLGTLDLGHHAEQLRTQQHLPLTLGQVGPDQQVETTVLVF
jgi:hypothetical protein